MVPHLTLRCVSSGPRTRVERERLVSENVSRHETQETGRDGCSPTFRTVEIVERVLEKEIETTQEKVFSFQVDTTSGEDEPAPPETAVESQTSQGYSKDILIKKRKRRRSRRHRKSVE